MRPSILLILLGAGFATTHHVVANIWIDGVDQGPGTCMRLPPDTSPVKGLNDVAMACNVGGSSKVDITCAANAGSKITFQWRTWPDNAHDTPIDVSHKGPCSVYMKKMGDKGVGNVGGGGWFKIWHDGFRDGQWCTDRLRSNGNRMSVVIPQDLAGGYYTLRAEHIALHQAQNEGGAQWYIGCAQLFLYSTGGNANPGNTVSIPGHVWTTHPGVLYNMYSMNPAPYKIPGPDPYIKTNSGGGSPIKVPFVPHSYKQCLVKNANWCAVSPPSYTNEATCWQASENCWQQLSTCFAKAPITGNIGCKAWEKTCTRYADTCRACSLNFCPKKKRDMNGHRHHARLFRSAI